MTREERIKKLQSLITCMKCEVSGKCCDDNCSTQYDAGNMGEIIENLEEIAKALEQELCENWYDVPSDEMTLEQARQAVRDLRKKLAEHLEQEQCVVNKKDLSDDEIKKFVEIMKKVPVQVIPKEPCDDCISRQAALDTFGLSEKSRKYGGDHSGYDTIMLYEVQDALEALPSVNSQPKMGHWIEHKHNGMTYIECSECSYGFLRFYLVRNSYCPNCGAKMEVSDEEKH